MKKHISFSCFSKLFSKAIFTLFFLLSTICIQAQIFTPSTDVQVDYKSCTGSGSTNFYTAGAVRVKIKIVETNSGYLNAFNLFYKNTSGTYVKILSIDGTYNTTDGNFNEAYGGGVNYAGFYYNGSGYNWSIGNRILENNNSEHYIEFIWNNAPTDAFNGGLIRLTSYGMWNSSSFGGSSASDVYSVVATVPLLTPPTNLLASDALYCDKVNITWTLPTSFPCGYTQQVYRNNTYIGTVYNNGTSYDDYSAGVGSVNYSLKAFYNSTYHELSSVISNNVTGKKKGIMTPVSGLDASKINCDGTIDLSWNFYSDNPIQFNIYRSTTTSFSSTPIGTVDGGDRTYTDNSVPSRNINYYYRIGTVGVCGETFSSAKAGASPTSPAAPTSVSTSYNGSNTGIIVNWSYNNNNNDITGFIIERSSPSSTTYENVDISARTFTDYNILPCVNYTYRIRAKNNCMPSGTSSTNTSTAKLTPTISNSFNGTTNKLKCTKGSNITVLEWSTINVDMLTSYKIFRKVYGSINDSVLIGSPNAGEGTFIDNYAITGVLYKYTLIGVLNCAGTLNYSNASEDLGFKRAYGTVSGKITYQGGISLKDAKVIVSPTSNSATSVGASMLFNGTGALNVASSSKLTFTSGITLETWFKANTVSGTKELISIVSGSKYFKLSLVNANLVLTAYNGSATRTKTSSASILADNYNQVSATFKADSMFIYINGIKRDSMSNAGFTLLPLNTSSIQIGNAFVGNLDEIRIYNYNKTKTEVGLDFCRKVSPDDDGLVAYYSFDENIPTYSGFFDYSKTGSAFNENHGTISTPSGPTFNNVVPSKSEMSNASYTDENGSYTVTYVTFIGGGENFTITPNYQTHAFDQIRNINISEGAAVFNQQDFIDQSSFTTSGFVYYAGTSCPAEGINFSIDGELVKLNGELVASSSTGAFSLQVPVGNHVLKTVKDGHVFSAGRFPSTDSYNFQGVTAGILFYDTTLVKVVGRAVGGAIEKNKLIGLGKSTNNIGKTRIHFKSQLSNGCSRLSVTTDNATGEYTAYLPPLIYTIDTLKITTNLAATFDIQSVLDLTNAVSTKVKVADTIYVNGTNNISRIDTTSYNVRRDFIIYNTPKLDFARTIQRTPTDSSFIGETQIVTSSNDTIKLIPTNPFGYPVFLQFKEYTAKVYAFETYTNYDNNPAVQYKVPLDGTLNVYNSFAGFNSATDTVGSIEIKNGMGLYTFRGGLPNLATNSLDPTLSFTKSLQAIFYTAGNTGVRFTEWLPNPGNTTYRAFLFGGNFSGSSFTTLGPQKVDLILRDPPGSLSSATWTKNTTFTTTKSFSNLNNTGGSFMGTVHLGAKFSQGVAFGALFSTEVEVGGNAGFGVTKESKFSTSGKKVETMSSSISISTPMGSNISEVGPKADIFFGKSTNYTFGVAKNLTFIKQDLCNVPGAICGNTTYNGYRLGLFSNLAVNSSGIATVFSYTVDEIEDVIIPNLVKSRNSVITNSKKTNGQRKYTVNYTNTSDPLYEKKFASNNDDPIWGSLRSSPNCLTQEAADKSGPSYTYSPNQLMDIDTVRWYNTQIQTWKQALAKNEKEKIDALNSNSLVVSNSSVGKATVTQTFSSTKSNSESSSTEIYLAHDEAYGFQAMVAGNGIELNGSLTLGETTSSENEGFSDTTVTISYTLQDGDDGDLISTNVIDPKTGNGHIFKTIGGQTSCPYEGEVWTNYYKSGDTITSTTYYANNSSNLKLSDGTARRHVPTIQITQPVKFNVPADQPATFQLQLGNQSESNDQQTYSLRVIDATNPYGATLFIDGLDPNKDFNIPYGTTITKTLTIKRGTVYYDYDSILLIIKSPCDKSIADSVYVSVHYIPTCTDANIYNPGDKWTLNNTFKDTMNVIIADYDYNFGGFQNTTFQYKQSSSSRWNILETFKIDADSTEAAIPTLKSYIEYAWNMKQLSDGPYDIRAVTTCSAPGHPDATKESRVKSGIADRVNPSPFGNPSPADGILSPSDEIQIQFNEPIDNASLSYQNFDIRGVLNGSTQQNTASLFFDGDNDYVEIPVGLNLTKKTFSLEFWAKRKGLGEQVIFSQGVDAAQFFSIGFNSSNKFNFRIGSEMVQCNMISVDSLAFHHFTVSYNYETSICELFIDGVVSNTGNTRIYNNYEGGGKTFIGKLSQNNGKFYSGNLRDFRLWTKTRASADILNSINISLRGTEAGILANWRMDEANGLIVKDYIRLRNAAIVNALWQVSPKGKAYRINTEPLSVSAPDIAFTPESDFTIEFWFKAANTNTNVCLFSNGKGDSTDVNPAIKWSIEKDSTGKMVVKHRGLIFEAVSTNYFDGNWHHFALVMQRATSLTAYIDGNLQNNVSPSSFQEFGGDKFILGGRLYQRAGDVIDRKLNGYIDEVRIWESARAQTQIETDRSNRLSGTESGLVFYLPFETYTLNLGVPILTPSIVDQLSLSRAITGVTSLGSGLNDETPTVKVQRPIQAINFVYSVNQDKIILTPTTLPELIENVTLDVTTKDVYDLNGNIMQSPKTWIAYVDKNQVKWFDQEFNFTKKAGETLTFSSNIVNSGGAVKQFRIENIPSWLSISPTSGIISPNSTKTIQFTISSTVNIGTYENNIQLLTDFGYPDNLLVKLKVYSEPPSTWAVNPANFQNSMSIIGQIRVNNVISTNADDKLAAFVNGECRGICGLEYFPQIDRYYAFLTVYSNVTDGENIEFKIWNAGAGKIHSDVTPNITFSSNGQIGSISSPQIFNASDKLTKYIPLAIGWNWISFNLTIKDSANLNSLFKGLHSTTGDLFKNQTRYADYSSNVGWSGNLGSNSTPIITENSYRFKSNTYDTLVISGVEIDPTLHPISLNSGWNWLGYVAQRNLSLTESFSSLSATTGDLVKSQTQFAVYDNSIGWVGSLSTLVPNKGYMYRAGVNSVFAYPRSAMFGKTGANENVYLSNYFKFNAASYDKNMSAIVDAGVCKNAVSSGRLSLGAYIGNELRGVTRSSDIGNGKNLYFINVSSNNDSDSISFKLLDEQTGKTFDLEGNLNFENNKLSGEIKAPVLLKTTPSFNCNDFGSNSSNQASIYVYPNPFSTKIIINVQGISGPKLDLKVFDITGKQVDAFDYNTLGNTNNYIEWNPTDKGIKIQQGIYFVEVSAGDNILRSKILKY